MNETLNATNATIVDRAADVASTATSFVPLVAERLWALVSAPFHHPDMLWILFPLAITFIVLEFYFDRHGDEELGWAAAVANSLILFIVALDLLRHSFPGKTPIEVFMDVGRAAFTDASLPLEPQVFILIIFLAGLGGAITVINYYHLLPRRIAFEVSGHPPVNFLAYFAITIVYSTHTEHPVPFDIPTLVAGALLYIVLLVIFFYVRRWIRSATGGRSRGGIWAN